jgi:hypothetical protein
VDNLIDVTTNHLQVGDEILGIGVVTSVNSVSYIYKDRSGRLIIARHHPMEYSIRRPSSVRELVEVIYDA